MVATTRVEKLSGILDYYTQAVVYAFATGTELDQSFTAPGATVALQGRDYGYDALGANAAAIATRKLTWRCIHRYATGESWPFLVDRMMVAFGHRRPVWLQKVRPDGVVLIAAARLTDFPNRQTVDSMVLADFTITFQMLGDWQNKDVAHPAYDAGYKYDAGQVYDFLGLTTAAIGAVTSFTLTNNGTTNERGAYLRLNGPMTAPMVLANYSSDVRGMPMLSGLNAQPMYLIIYFSLGATDFLSIDSRTGVIVTSVAGVVPWSLVVKAPGQKYYFEILPGVNQCQLTKNDVAAAGSLSVIARDRYVT